jgi:hypothetical protein
MSNIESRFGSEIESLEKRIDRIGKIQQKLELDAISTRRRGK